MMKLCRALALLAICVLQGACGSGAAQKGKSPSVAPATAMQSASEFVAELALRRFLLQPELFWSNGDVTEQGTAFLVKLDDGRHFAVTSAHFLNFEGPLLERVQLRDVTTDAVLAAPESSWGRPGAGGVNDPVTDLNEDLLILPLEKSAFADFSSVRMQGVPDLSVGQVVLLPNKQPDSSIGHVTIKGKLVELAAGYVRVELDTPMMLSSQSGSPVLSESGDLVGVVSRSYALDNGKVTLLLTPAHAVFRGVSSAAGRFPLRSVVGKAGHREEVALRYRWPPGMRLPTRFRKYDSARRVEAAFEYVRLTEKSGEGIQVRGADFVWRGAPISEEVNEKVIGMMSSAPAFSVDAKGVFFGMDDPTGSIEQMLLLNQLPESAQQSLRAASPKVIRAILEADWTAQVAMWTAADLTIGSVYELQSEGQSPIGGAIVPTTTHFAATHRTACSPEDAARSCIVLTTHQHHDAEALSKAALSLALTLIPPEKHDEARREMSSFRVESTVRTVVVTRPDSLIPAHFVREAHYSMPGTKHGYRLQEWAYDPPTQGAR